MTIQAIIFDLGSVLVCEVDRTPRERLAARLGLTYGQVIEAVFGHPDDCRAAIGEVTTEAYFRAAAQPLGIAPDELYREFFAGNQLDRPLADFVRTLRGPYKTALLSNAFDDLRRMVENVWQIADCFDEIIISAEVGMVKPDPRIYHLTLERLGVAPQEAIFVDDKRRNTDAAQKVGLHAIQFQNTEQAKKEIAALLKNDG